MDPFSFEEFYKIRTKREEVGIEPETPGTAEENKKGRQRVSNLVTFVEIGKFFVSASEKSKFALPTFRFGED